MFAPWKASPRKVCPSAFFSYFFFLSCDCQSTVVMKIPLREQTLHLKIGLTMTIECLVIFKLQLRRLSFTVNFK